MNMIGQEICEKETQESYNGFLINNNDVMFYCVSVTVRYCTLEFEGENIVSVSKDEDFFEIMSSFLGNFYNCNVIEQYGDFDVAFENGTRVSLRIKECTEQEASVLIKFL